MKDQVSKEQLEVKNRMETSRNIIGIVNLLGLIGLFIELVTDGFYFSSLVWAIANIVGLLYWYQGRQILSGSAAHPAQIGALKKYFYSYIFCWVLGAATTAFVWGVDSVGFAIGIILVLVSTFMMSRFQGDAALLMVTE